METIIIYLLLLGIALLIYVIALAKNEKKVLHNEDPLAGLPDIIGKPKDASNYSSPSTTAQSKREVTLSITDNFDKRDEGTPKIYKISQEGPEVAENILPDWMEEEEEMGRYSTYGTEDGFATGVTFDELATVGKVLDLQVVEPSEEKIVAGIISKIDGTELLQLLESKIGDASKRIAMLLDDKLLHG